MTYDQYAAEIQRLQDALARVAKEAVPQWISTKDRMPDKDGNYLVVTDGIGYFRGYPGHRGRDPVPYGRHHRFPVPDRFRVRAYDRDPDR